MQLNFVNSHLRQPPRSPQYHKLTTYYKCKPPQTVSVNFQPEILDPGEGGFIDAAIVFRDV